MDIAWDLYVGSIYSRQRIPIPLPFGACLEGKSTQNIFKNR